VFTIKNHSETTLGPGGVSVHIDAFAMHQLEESIHFATTRGMSRRRLLTMSFLSQLACKPKKLRGTIATKHLSFFKRIHKRFLTVCSQDGEEQGGRGGGADSDSPASLEPVSPSRSDHSSETKRFRAFELRFAQPNGRCRRRARSRGMMMGGGIRLRPAWNIPAGGGEG
jgi:hypothetical protein